MNYQVKVEPEALADIQQITDWYSTNLMQRKYSKMLERKLQMRCDGKRTIR